MDTKSNDAAWYELRIEAWREYCKALKEIYSADSTMEFARTCSGRGVSTEESAQKEIDRTSENLKHAKNRLLDLGEKLP